MARLTFKDRNKDKYVKNSDALQLTIDKYIEILPNEMINIWKTMGFGVYEEGFIQLVDPDEYNFVFDYIDILLEPSIVFGITVLGDLLIWEGNKNWTIAPDEGNRVKLIDIRKCESRVLGDIDFLLNYTLGDITAISDKSYFDAKPYLEMKDILPKLEYGQCYGYVPALALGGSKSNKNLQVVDAKSYIDIIGQSVGKIIDLED